MIDLVPSRPGALVFNYSARGRAIATDGVLVAVRFFRPLPPRFLMWPHGPLALVDRRDGYGHELWDCDVLPFWFQSDAPAVRDLLVGGRFAFRNLVLALCPRGGRFELDILPQP
jgi:hypothetical protein